MAGPTFPTFFSPWSATIASIVAGLTTTVNTVQANDYGVGLQVRLVIPIPCKAQELNNVVAPISKINSNTQFELPINSLSFHLYVRTGNDVYIGQVIPVSEPATTLNFVEQNNGNILPAIYGTPPTPNVP
jgi:hypothetical protein